VLDFYNIPYKTVEVNPLTKAELLASPDSRQKRVPFAVFNDASQSTLSDSSIIIQHLIDRGLVPNDTGLAITKLSLLNRMSILMFPNITRNFLASWQAFNYVNHVPTFSPFQRLYNHVLGAVAMVFANGRLKRKYAIDDPRGELVQVAQNFLKERQTLLEKNPSSASVELLDVQMFGTVKAIEGLDTHSWLLKEGCVDFGGWYADVEKQMAVRMSNFQTIDRVHVHSSQDVKSPEAGVGVAKPVTGEKTSSIH
jgi:microsomal prostaglandin-E synthase 2